MNDVTNYQLTIIICKNKNEKLNSIHILYIIILNTNTNINTKINTKTWKQ